MNPTKKYVAQIMGVFLITALFIATSAQQSGGASYPAWEPKDLTRSATCKLCHSKDATGNQWKKWESGPHAKAFEALKSDKAKAIGAKLGIDDPSTSGSCLRCHSTAYGFTEQQVSKTVKVDESVGCQTCHGPGNNYKSKSRHADKPEEAVAKYGLIMPNEANTCSRCHNESNPTYDPNRYTTKDGRKVDFDYEQALEKIKHPLK